MMSPMVLIRKVVPVLPNPLMILKKALFVYKNGQIQAKVTMNCPAVLLPNKVIPIKPPNKRKKRQQTKPSIKQAPADFLMILSSSFLLHSVWISAIVGISITDTELVMAEGNRMQGRAIPLSTP